jgi:hypothetical protein
MTLFDVLLLHTFIAGFLGLAAMGHEASWKLSSETTGSQNLFKRWSYRYLIFSFWFMLSFMSLGPLTTGQLIKIPEVQAFGRVHIWLLFVLDVPPALLLYYLHRRFMRWADPRKVEGRKKLAARIARLGR